MKAVNGIYSQSGTVAAAATLTAIDVTGAAGYSLTLENTVTTASAADFVDADVDVDADTITIAAHGYYTGLKAALTNALGALPGGLSATNYYIIRVDADTIKLAASASDALAGTAVDITTAAGGGTHTLTPAAISGASYKLQGAVKSAAGVAGTYVDLSVTGNITGTGNVIYEKLDPMYDFVRLVFALSAGQIAYVLTVSVKER